MSSAILRSTVSGYRSPGTLADQTMQGIMRLRSASDTPLCASFASYVIALPSSAAVHVAVRWDVTMRGTSLPRLAIIFSFLVKMASSSFKHLSQLKPYIPYIAVLIFIAVLFCTLSHCYHNGVHGALSTRVQGFANPPMEKLIMYYADWCPHCQTAKPELKNLGLIQTIGEKKVAIEMVEEKDIPAAVKPTISGYPTIQLQNVDGSVKAEYSGDRTTAGFLEFLKQNA